MSDKWTSGPWFVRHSFERSEIVSGRTVIAETQNSQAATEALDSNDRLLAAAPSMAALLRDLLYSANGHELPIPLALKLQEAKQLLKDLEG